MPISSWKLKTGRFAYPSFFHYYTERCFRRANNGLRDNGHRGRHRARCRPHCRLFGWFILEAPRPHQVRALVRGELPVEGGGPVRVLRARGVEGEVRDERQI